MSTTLTNTEGTEGRYQAVRALALDGPSALDQLVHHLSDESWRVRKAAVDRLNEIRPVDAMVRALVAVLDRPGDVPARNAAAEALARVGLAAVPSLAGLLRHENADARKFAADILGVVGHADAVESLARALEDPDQNVRAGAAEALGKIGGARAALALERALALPDHLLRVSVLDGLWRIGAVPSTSVLETLARDRYLRRPIYRLLGRSRDPRVLGLLVTGLADPGRGTREAALAAIAEQARLANGFFWGRLVLAVRRSGIPAPTLASTVSEALSREDVVVGEGALLILGALGRAEDARLLVETGAQPRYREAARAAMAGLGPGAVVPLVAALPEMGSGALLVAAEFLGPESGAELEPRLLAALESAPPDLLPFVVEALGAVGAPTVLGPLVQWAQRHDLEGEVIAALEHLGQRRPEDSLAAARAEWTARPTAIVARVLGVTGGEPEVSLLVAALRHADSGIRVASARALEHLGNPAAIDHLRTGLTDESEEVRAGFLRALAGLQCPDLEALVRLALKDAAPLVTETAARLAGDLGLVGVADLLPALVEGRQTETCLAALESLERLERLGPSVLESATMHHSPEVCMRAMTVSATRAGGLELVRTRLGHARWEVRRAAARVLGAAGEGDELAALERALSTESDSLVAESLRDAVLAIEARTRA